MIEKNTKKVISELNRFLYLCNKINKHHAANKDFYEFVELYNKYRSIIKNIKK